MIDLHTHTNASDGELSAKELIDLAIESKLKAIAITDHDTVKSCEEAIEYAKGKDIEVVPGIEISCYEKGKGFVEVHVVGLFVDYKNEELLKFCEEMKEERIKQKKLIIGKFQDLGFDITFKEVEEITKGNMGRPHIAKVLVIKYPQEFSYVGEVFDKYLGNGKAAYVERSDQTKVKHAIELIKRAGGIPILAHPGIYQKEDALELIDYFSSVGGKGVETYYPYTLINGVSEEKFKDLSNAFREAAKKNGLLESGGSDFHGKTRKNVFLNQMNIPYFILENLKKNLPQA